ncbi:MAG TPA: TM2 domain-containing protein [Xanthobacteraceae bacterium]|jgi:TM2 domain-containing membrane protein YozV
MSDERSVGIAQAALHQGPLSKDARTLLLYDANRKSAVIAYILWFFLGWFGAHNFYLGRKGVGIAQVLLTISVIGWFITFFWVLVDAFLIPGWVRRENNLLLMQLGA